MNVLILSNVPTHPVTEGNRKAILNQVELFRSLGHDVYFLYIRETPLLSKKKRDLSRLKSYWGEGLFVFELSRIEHAIHIAKRLYRKLFYKGVTYVDDYYPYMLNSYLRKIDKKYKFDCLIVNYYYLSKALLIKGIPLRGLYTHDYFAYKSILVGTNKVGYNTDAHQEAVAMQRAPNIFALNTEEAFYFNKLSPKSKVYNTFSFYNYIPTKYVGNKNILFFSGKNSFNLNGFKWFIEKIYPLILEQIPDVKLIIGGGICRELEDIQIPNSKLVGFVDDPLEFYKLGDIVINPTYQGTGLKIKTFEAISFGKVVIAHPHSITGIFKKEEAPVFSSACPQEWVDYIKKILGNSDEIAEIKRLDKNYILQMDEFVVNEYKRFFIQ